MQISRHLFIFPIYDFANLHLQMTFVILWSKLVVTCTKHCSNAYSAISIPKRKKMRSLTTICLKTREISKRTAIDSVTLGVKCLFVIEWINVEILVRGNWRENTSLLVNWVIEKWRWCDQSEHHFLRDQLSRIERHLIIEWRRLIMWGQTSKSQERLKWTIWVDDLQ